ncbi:MAG: 2-amino-3-carboxymuconate-6-semialdehyde decarboxylase [Euryarchaeota archaeon]|nr:2-amino-3-carboxymuconate-6-semialdehyde decarboxylase [Euryarchaeota archaeon]
MKIDVHTHILPRYMPKWSEKFGYGNFIHLEEGSRPGFARMMQGDTFFREIASNCWDEEERIGEYAESGVQVQVVCTIPVMFSYNAKPNDTLELGRFLNDHIADLVAKYPKKYIGLCTVPMQDTELAIQELERATSIGLVGVQIGSNINGMNLNDPQFFPFFQACERLGMAILIHPWDMMGKPQMEKYWLPWLVGMPAEVSRAACSLIFGGVFERLPNLRVLFSHASGAFLATLGRIEHGFNCRPDLVAIDNHVNPREYCGKFWVDSITHDERLLRYVLELQGSDRICMGTDYPFPLGDLKFGEYMEKMNLDSKSLDDLFHGSALSWLDLDLANYK